MMKLKAEPFGNGIALAAALMKRKPALYFIGLFMLCEVMVILLGGIVSMCVVPYVLVGVFEKACIGELGGWLVSSAFSFIFILLTFPSTVGCFKYIRQAADGKDISAWIIFTEYKNVFHHLTPNLILSALNGLGVLFSYTPVILLWIFRMIAFNVDAMWAWQTFSLMYPFALLLSCALSLILTIYLLPIQLLIYYDVSEGKITAPAAANTLRIFKTFSMPLMLWILLAIILSFSGLILCCIGMIVTLPAGTIVMWHLCRVFRGDDVRNDAAVESAENNNCAG